MRELDRIMEVLIEELTPKKNKLVYIYAQPNREGMEIGSGMPNMLKDALTPEDLKTIEDAAEKIAMIVGRTLEENTDLQDWVSGKEHDCKNCDKYDDCKDTVRKEKSAAREALNKEPMSRRLS